MNQHFTPNQADVAASIAAEIERIEGLLINREEGQSSGDVLNPEEWLFYRDHILQKWETKKSLLEVAKEEEMDVRKAAVEFLSDPMRQKGTENVPLGNGYVAKMVKKINYGWAKNFEGNTDKNKIEAALKKIEETGAVGELIADRLVKWTPELSLTEYNQLTPEYKSIIDTVVITTAGAPTLEIVAPKAPKK